MTTRTVIYGTAIVTVDENGSKLWEEDTRDFHPGKGQRKCPAVTWVRLWTKAQMLVDCSLVFDHKGVHKTWEMALCVTGKMGRINFVQPLCAVCLGQHDVMIHS